jgi:hypothetical protein
MELLPLALIVAAVGLVIGEYALLSAYEGRKYVTRYKALKDAFSKWQNQETKTLWSTLGQKARKKEPPDDIIDFLRQWIWKSKAVGFLDTGYHFLGLLTKVIMILGGVSAFLGLLALTQPTTQPQILETSAAFFGLAVATTFFYIWWLHEMTSVLAEFELGKSLDDIVKILAKKMERYG